MVIDTEWRGDDEEIKAVDFQEENDGISATNSGEEEEEDVSSYDDIDQTWIPLFREKTGVLVDTVNFEPVDYFKLFFPGDLYGLISGQTNLFAEQFFENPSDLNQHSQFQKWTDTSPRNI